MNRNMRSRGFTLVEALVAIVIISSIFTTVWTWFGSATITTKKIENAVEIPFVIDQFLEHLNTQNLNTTPSGEYEYQEYKIVWNASLQRSSQSEFSRRQLAWQLALYNVTLDIYKNDVLLLKTETRKYEQWKDPNYQSPSGLFG